ncbi:serum response factor-like [Gadus macrocephalus]|uniref:serum response factor-like n=1 Tax=Gadus macrocephalus TaxID=80720 RepID=UPI0028CB48BD|nr:serum response factor-like [Gadus macrocephalus]
MHDTILVYVYYAAAPLWNGEEELFIEPPFAQERHGQTTPESPGRLSHDGGTSLRTVLPDWARFPTQSGNIAHGDFSLFVYIPHPVGRTIIQSKVKLVHSWLLPPPPPPPPLQDTLKPAFTVASLPGGVVTSGQSTVPTTSTSMQVSSSFPITNYLAPVSAGGGNSGANGTLLKAGGGATSGVMQLPGGFTFMPAGTALPPGTPTIPLSQLQHHSLALAGQHAAQGAQAVFRFPAAVSLAATASMPANIVTTSGSAGHMMYPSPHTVMYTSSPALTDGGLAVLNAFSQGSSSMHVSHGQGQDSGGVPQVFLAAPPGSVQIPVSAVQLHPMVIGQQSSGSSSTLTELKVVNLDAAQGSKGD